MVIKKILLHLQIILTIICPIGIIFTKPAAADSFHYCYDLETYFVEGYGWSTGFASSKDSRAFDEALNQMLWDEESGSFKIEYAFRSETAVVDFPTRPNWVQVANIILNPLEANTLREDIDTGGEYLAGHVNYDEYFHKCPNTKYIIAGFGMGAAKARRALEHINPDKVLYVALFSDPTLYLPEGKGLIPDACLGKNLSDYRMYVPNCYTHDGVLGGSDPYVPAGYEGKLGTWCNKDDMFCGSGISMQGNSRYEEDGIYEDAAKVIYSKVRQAYNLERVYSIHDTAIMIDSTASMGSLIKKYKSEAMNLAKRTLETGGRIALYDYRDYADPYYPLQYCSFETCTLQKIQESLDSITADGGGDNPESVLWSAKIIMNDLNWRRGATKSLVILTDDEYHDPDLDGTTRADIVKLSKQIDPVNIYVITPPFFMDGYSALTSETGGIVASSTDDISLVTTTIMERYDSLPRVEESEAESEGDVSDVELIKSLLARNAQSTNTDSSIVADNNSSINTKTTQTIKKVEATKTIEVANTVETNKAIENPEVLLTIPKAPDTGRR